MISRVFKAMAEAVSIEEDLMKGNYESVQDFVKEVERIEIKKADYLAPQGRIKMVYDSKLEIDGTGVYDLNEVSHIQVADKFGIPKRYYDDMAQVPGLRSHNVNAWLEKAPDRKKLVRTLDGKARAFLSDRFQVLDNFMILSTFLPIVHDFSNVKIMSTSLTERKMYIQVVFPTLQAEVRVGDVVQSGIILTNSEVWEWLISVP
jgi:hypothetical protein